MLAPLPVISKQLLFSFQSTRSLSLPEIISGQDKESQHPGAVSQGLFDEINHFLLQ